MLSKRNKEHEEQGSNPFMNPFQDSTVDSIMPSVDVTAGGGPTVRSESGTVADQGLSTSSGRIGSDKAPAGTSHVDLESSNGAASVSGGHDDSESSGTISLFVGDASVASSENDTSPSSKSNETDANRRKTTVGSDGDDGLDVLAEIVSGGSDDGSASFIDSGDGDDTPSGGGHNWLRIVMVIVIILLVVGVGVGAYFASHPQSKKIDNSSKVGGNSIGGSGSSEGNPAPVSQEKKFLKNIGVPDFYQVPKDDQTDDQKSQAVEYSLVTQPANAVGRFMSKESNPDLTDDPSKFMLKDGSTNPNYSYLTGENTTAVIRDDMERLVNPVYGGWTFLQDAARLDTDGMPQTVDSVGLSDMFDPAVSSGKKGEAGLREIVNLYADWDINEYGGEWHNKYTGDPIVGQIVDYNCDYNVKGAVDDTISCTAQVRYTGVITDENGGKTTKNVDKTLKLNYKVNYDSESANDRRILLTSVEQ